MVSDPDDHASSLSLENISAITHSKSPKPPKLRLFRALQLIALMFALSWLLGATLVSHYLIEGQLKEGLSASNLYVQGEARHLLDALSQNLYRAEQLSKTLSFDQTVISLAEYAKAHQDNYTNLPEPERVNYILTMLGANRVNQLFEQIARGVGLYQVLLLDESAYCVGSSRYSQPNGCIGVNYKTREYYLRARDEGGGRQFAIGHVLPVPSFFFSTAIKQNNQFVGAVVVRQEMQQVVGFLNHQKNPTFITGNDGIVLSSSREEWIYHYMGAEFFPAPDLNRYQQLYHRNKIEALQLNNVKLPFGDYPFVKMNNQVYILAKAKVEANDFHIFVLENVDQLISNYYNSWKLAITIIMLGLMLIIMIERNLNYGQHRIAHLNALSEANKQLAHLTNELYGLSVTDPLTGISNRRYFRARLQDEIHRAQRRINISPQNDALLALMIIDIDEFKKVNDRYGHPAGDKAITVMANICTDAVRQYDCVGRIGGEEFAILLTDADSSQACDVAERIRRACAEQVIEFEDFGFSQTCSIGIASFKAGDSADSLLSRADKALYSAKSAGRNCFVYSA